MAKLSDIATSRDYRTSDREGQRAMLSEADPKGFGSLLTNDQDLLMNRVDAELGRDWWEGEFDESFKRGAANTAAHFANVAANAVDLSNPDNLSEAIGGKRTTGLEDYLREKEEEWIEAGTSPWTDKTNLEIGAEALGSVAVAVPAFAAAIKGGTAGLIGLGVNAAAAGAIATIGTGFLSGALSRIDQGWVESLTAGSRDAAFFALFPLLGKHGLNAGRAASGAILGGAAYKMTPEEMDQEERIGHGATMAILAGIFNAKASAARHARKPGNSPKNPKVMPPETEAKVMGEDAMNKKMQQRAFEKMEKEQLAEDQLDLPRDPAKAEELNKTVEKAPPEERAMVEEARAVEKAAEARRPRMDPNAALRRIESLKMQRARLPEDELKAASEKVIDQEIKDLESEMNPDRSDSVKDELEIMGERYIKLINTERHAEAIELQDKIIDLEVFRASSALQKSNPGEFLPAFEHPETGEVRAGGMAHHQLLTPAEVEQLTPKEGEPYEIGDKNLGWWDVDKKEYINREEMKARGGTAGMRMGDAPEAPVRVVQRAQRTRKDLDIAGLEKVVQEGGVPDDPGGYRYPPVDLSNYAGNTVEPLKPTPYKYRAMDVDQPTTGKVFYHGTKAPVHKAGDLNPIPFGNAYSMMGQGLYLTDNPAVGKSYAKNKGHGKEQKVFSVTLNNLQLIDMESPLPPHAKTAFSIVNARLMENPDSPVEGTELSKTLANPSFTGVDLMEALKEDMVNLHLDTNEALEVYGELHDQLVEIGIDGVRHEGGKTWGKKQFGPHNVVILFDDLAAVPKRPLSGKFTDNAVANVESNAARRAELEADITQLENYLQEATSGAAHEGQQDSFIKDQRRLERMHKELDDMGPEPVQPPPRAKPEGQGDPSGGSARGRNSAENIWQLGVERKLPKGWSEAEREQYQEYVNRPQLAEGDTGKGFRGEEETFRGQFEERFGKAGEFPDQQLPPGGGGGGGGGGGSDVPAPRVPEVAMDFVRESSKWDKRRVEYVDDGHGARWMMEELGMEDGPDNLQQKFNNLRGIPDAQDGMVRWGVPTMIPDPNVHGRSIVSFEPISGYDVIAREVTHSEGYEGNYPPEIVYEAVQNPNIKLRGAGEVVMPIMGRGRKYEEDSWDYFQARQSNELITQHVKPDGTIRRATQAEVDALLTREKNWSLDKIEENLAKADPTRVAVYEAMKEWQRRMKQFYIDTGYITPEQANAFQREEFAFSFMRQMEQGKQGRYRKQDNLAGSFGIRKMLGSKRDLSDRFTSWIQGPQNHFRAALQNQWVRELVDTADAAGGFMEVIPASAERIVIGKRTLRRALLEDVMELDGLTEAQAAARRRWVSQMPGDVERVGFFVGANRPYGTDILSYLRDGKPQYRKVYDQVMLRLFEQMNREGRVGIAGRWMSGFKRFKQEMITADPSFMAANLTRDPAMATMMTRTGSQALTSALRGLAHTMARSEEYKLAIANGLGGSSMRDGVRMTRSMLIKHAERQNRHFMNPRNLLFGPKDMWRWLRETGRAIEMGPRVGEYLRAREGGVYGPRYGEPSPMHEAVNAGAEISTDFRRRGGGQPTGVPGWLEKVSGGRLSFTAGPEMTKFMADTVPFFNAMMAGSDKGYRSVARDPHGKKATGFKMGMVGILSMYLYAHNRDMAKKYAHLKYEDGRPQVDFLNLPLWATTTAWHYYIPDKWDAETGEPVHFTHYHQPKIWEVGMIGSWGERFAQYMMDAPGENPELLADMLDITARNFNINLGPKGVPIPLPAGIDIITEQGMNTIAFTGQPIETRGMDEWEDWARSRSNTSRTLQAYGELVKDLPLWEPVKSPARAEALLRGIFGNWASMGLHVTDEFFFPGGPALGWDDVPIVRRFYSEAGKYDKNTQMYYQNLEEFNQAFGTMREMSWRRNKDMVNEIKMDPDQRAMIQMAPGFDRANRRVQNFNREIDLLKRGVAEPEATPRQRHHLINRIEAKRNRAMKMLNIQANRAREKARRTFEAKHGRKIRENQKVDQLRNAP